MPSIPPSAASRIAAAPLLALLAHELRNPLTPMRLRIQLARAGRPGDEDLARSFDVMERQIDYLQRMVDDLATWARPAGTVDLVTRHRVDLGEVVRSCVDAFSPLAGSRSLDLTLDLPPGPQPVLGDEDRLMQLLINLLGNAAKFTPAGGSIRVSLARAGHEVHLQVKDSGMGIHPRQLARVFEPFYTGSGPAGLGLGLAVVRQVAAAHGGWTRADSAGPEQGATFTVGLPLQLD